MTSSGLESTFATNTLGPVMMARALLPLLATNGGIVITMSSGGMLTEEMHPEDPEFSKKYNGTKAYARTKVCNSSCSCSSSREQRCFCPRNWRICIL